MINYQTNPSAFFIANKKYCEIIEDKLKSFNYEYSGFCNSYGYEIESNFKRNKLSCHLKYEKHQTSRNGVIVPMDASDYAGVNLIVEGFNKTSNLSFGKKSLKRLLSPQKCKDAVPAPYYVSTTENSLNTALIKILLDNKIDLFKLKNGIARIKIHSASIDIFDLIAELEKLLSSN